jgi:hypothetical protein
MRRVVIQRGQPYPGEYAQMYRATDPFLHARLQRVAHLPNWGMYAARHEVLIPGEPAMSPGLPTQLQGIVWAPQVRGPGIRTTRQAMQTPYSRPHRVYGPSLGQALAAARTMLPASRLPLPPGVR